ETVEVHGRLIVSQRGDSSVEIHSGDEIRASGAQSLPEFLSRLPEFSAADEVGNGRQLSLGLRGFAGDSGATAFLVDGLRLNDPDTNASSFELIPLEDIERID